MVEFREFFERFKDAWKNNSLGELVLMIDKGFQAREIVKGLEIVDFGYDESVKGWEQAFSHFKNIDSEWILTEVNTIPLRKNEVMAILWATLNIEGKPIGTANLFCQTFKRINDAEWKLVRSYIEASVPVE